MGDDSLRILVLALLFDALIGDPDWLWQRVPHPVVMFGRAIDWLDKSFNRESWSEASRRRAGVASIAILVAVAGALGWFVARALQVLPLGWVLQALVALIFLAQRSLYEHVARVQTEFVSGGL